MTDYLGSVALLGIIWTRKNKKEGVIAGVFVGMYMFLFGFVTLILLGETEALFVDSIRGFLTLVLVIWLIRKSKNNNTSAKWLNACITLEVFLMYYKFKIKQDE